MGSRVTRNSNRTPRIRVGARVLAPCLHDARRPQAAGLWQLDKLRVGGVRTVKVIQGFAALFRFKGSQQIFSGNDSNRNGAAAGHGVMAGAVSAERAHRHSVLSHDVFGTARHADWIEIGDAELSHGYATCFD